MQDDEYEVKRIVGRNTVDGVVFFLIEWEGYDETENTWEKEENLLGNEELIDVFVKAYKEEHPYGKLGELKYRQRKMLLENAYDPLLSHKSKARLKTKQQQQQHQSKSETRASPQPKAQKQAADQAPKASKSTKKSKASKQIQLSDMYQPLHSKRALADLEQTQQQQRQPQSFITSGAFVPPVYNSIYNGRNNDSLSPTSTVTSSPPVTTPIWIIDDGPPRPLGPIDDNDMDPPRKIARMNKPGYETHLSFCGKLRGKDDYPEFIWSPAISGFPTVYQVAESHDEIEVYKNMMSQSVDLAKTQGHRLITNANGQSTFAGVVPRVTVRNDADDTPFPEMFVYISEMVLNHEVSRPDPAFLVGCDCPDGCLTHDDHVCHEENSYNRDGRLKEGHSGPIYECNATCGCGASCRNRVVQRGRTFELEIFKTADKGWGVKAMCNIPKRSFVEQYMGEVITEQQSEFRGHIYDRIGLSYLFDMDTADEDEYPVKYVIDSYVVGNVSHYFNHSCDPNLACYGVFYDSGDVQFHRLAFFAIRDIKKGEELTFDYLGPGDRNVSLKGKKLSINCLCGTKACRGFVHAGSSS
ncbi:hypothetical protein BC940DRAFT_370146 [Gongronella butleri]|nr:hypothetical protein BC940DRAFT_370146 [Gongronella butleri]